MLEDKTERQTDRQTQGRYFESLLFGRTRRYQNLTTNFYDNYNFSTDVY